MQTTSGEKNGFKIWSKNSIAAKFVEAGLKNGDIDLNYCLEQVYMKFTVLRQIH